MKNLSIIALVFLIFALGCGLPGRLANLGSNSGSGNGSSGGDTSAPSGNPRDDVIRASRKFLDLPRFGAKMDSMGTSANQMHIKFDYVAPDRFHMIYFDAGGQPKSEMTMIGNDTYVKFGGKWQKMPGGGGAKMPNLRQYFDEKGLETLQDVKYVGDETLDGQATHVYSYRNNQTDANTPYPFTSKIWIGTSDDMPRKIEVTYEGGELKTMTVVYDYSSNITVEPPI